MHPHENPKGGHDIAEQPCKIDEGEKAHADRRNFCLKDPQRSFRGLSARSQSWTEFSPVFEPQNARQEFESFLNGRGLRQSGLDPAGGFDALFDFYRDMRPQGSAFEQHEDADMLLFQWGIFDWGKGEHFALDLTRQLILTEDAEDEDIWQLNLTFELEPNDELRALGDGNKWCGSRQELDEFREYVRRSAAFTTCTGLPIRRTVLDYGVAG